MSVSMSTNELYYSLPVFDVGQLLIFARLVWKLTGRVPTAAAEPQKKNAVRLTCVEYSPIAAKLQTIKTIEHYN